MDDINSNNQVSDYRTNLRFEIKLRYIYSSIKKKKNSIIFVRPDKYSTLLERNGNLLLANKREREKIDRLQYFSFQSKV